MKLIQLQLIANLFPATSPKNVKDVSTEDTTKNSTKVIVIVLTLLALLLLITLIVFYVMYLRRRNLRKQGNSRSSIQFFAMKQISFCYTKFRRLFVIPTPYSKYPFLEISSPSGFPWTACSCCLV